MAFFSPGSPSVVDSNRVLYTASSFARASLFHLQEIGELKALQSHTSSRSSLQSYLFFVVIEGTGTLDYDDHHYQLQQGACVFIDCHKSYSHSTDEKNLWRIKWIHFYGPTMNSICEKYCERGGQPVFVPDAAVISGLLDVWKKLMDTASSFVYMRDMLINQHLAEMMTLLMGESWHPETKKPATKKASMLAVKEWIDGHYAGKVTLDDLADRFYINKYYLSKMFKNQFGQTIFSYLQTVRITHVKQLLRFSTKSLEEIGEDVGITPARYLSEVFSAVEGVSPSVYRKQW